MLDVLAKESTLAAAYGFCWAARGLRPVIDFILLSLHVLHPVGSEAQTLQAFQPLAQALAS